MEAAQLVLSAAKQQGHTELAAEESEDHQAGRPGSASPLVVRRSSAGCGAAGSSPASRGSSARASPQQGGGGASRGGSPLPEQATVPQSQARPRSRLAGSVASAAAEHAADVTDGDDAVAEAAQSVPADGADAIASSSDGAPAAAPPSVLSPAPAANQHTATGSSMPATGAAAARAPGALAPVLSDVVAPAPAPAAPGRLLVPSPAAMLAAMHTSKAKQAAGSAAAARPGSVDPDAAAAQHGAAVQPDGAAADGAATTAALRKPSPEPESTDGSEGGADGARPKSGDERAQATAEGACCAAG